MQLLDYQKKMVQLQASDLFVTAGMPVAAKINGNLQPIDDKPLNNADSLRLVLSAMNDKQQHEFNSSKECNFALANEAGRFRVSAFWQREQAGMVMRRIVTTIPDVDDLRLPAVLKDIIMSKRGLVLLVGATGSGKSTSLAALIGHRNKHAGGHILTIEDPIEFMHQHQRSLITQREVGVDTESFDAALKSALRQAPDVILIGEIRSQETMEYALSFAETGHLCIASLHANNANQAIDRIMHLVPKTMHDKLLFDLSLNLRAIVAQQLIPTSNGKSRVAAVEVLLNSPLIADLISKGDIAEIKNVMAKSRELGMQTFDQALYALHEQGEISAADAIHHADSPNDLRLMLKLRHNAAVSSGLLSGVTLAGIAPKSESEY